MNEGLMELSRSRERRIEYTNEKANKQNRKTNKYSNEGVSCQHKHREKRLRLPVPVLGILTFWCGFGSVPLTNGSGTIHIFFL